MTNLTKYILYPDYMQDYAIIPHCTKQCIAPRYLLHSFAGLRQHGFASVSIIVPFFVVTSRCVVQFLPPWAGAGLSHRLIRINEPFPHVTEHFAHSVQLLQSP